MEKTGLRGVSGCSMRSICTGAAEVRHARGGLRLGNSPGRASGSLIACGRRKPKRSICGLDSPAAGQHTRGGKGGSPFRFSVRFVRCCVVCTARQRFQSRCRRVREDAADGPHLAWYAGSSLVPSLPPASQPFLNQPRPGSELPMASMENNVTPQYGSKAPM